MGPYTCIMADHEDVVPGGRSRIRPWRPIARASVVLYLASRHPGDLSAPCWRAERRRAAAARLGHNSSIGEQLQIGAGAAAARVGQSSTVGEQSYAWRVSRGSPSTRFDLYSIFF